MKTMVKEYAIKLDNAIEDVNKEYALDAGIKIADDLHKALVAYGITWVYLVDATVHTTKLAVRSAKTGTKAFILNTAKLYNETDTTVIVRR